MEREEEENNRCNQQTIRPNNPSRGSSSSTDNISSEEWWSIYLDINASCCIFWNNCLWKLDILFNVMDIVSQLKDKGFPIIVPFCMTKSLFFIYTKIHFNLFYCVVQCRCEMLHQWLNIIMKRCEMWWYSKLIQTSYPNALIKI